MATTEITAPEVQRLDTGYRATYSPDDNKLRLYAGGRLPADLYARVKAAGFKWAPQQQLFVAPMWTPQREDLALELCGEIDDEEYAQMCWPSSAGMPITIYIGDGDAVIELAEDEKSTQELADSFAELAGIVLVDDWDEGDEEDGEGA